MKKQPTNQQTDAALTHTQISPSRTLHTLTHAGVAFSRETSTGKKSKISTNYIKNKPWIASLRTKSPEDGGEHVGFVVAIHRDGKITFGTLVSTDCHGAETLGKALQAASILAMQLQTGTRNFENGELA